MNGEFFDIFGFLILFYIGLKVYNSKDKKLKNHGIIILLISLIGIIVDGIIVIGTYLLG